MGSPLQHAKTVLRARSVDRLPQQQGYEGGGVVRSIMYMWTALVQQETDGEAESGVSKSDLSSVDVDSTLLVLPQLQLPSG